MQRKRRFSSGATKTPDVYGTKKRRVSSEGAFVAQDSVTLNQITNTTKPRAAEKALNGLRKYYVERICDPSVPPLMLQSQVYASIPADQRTLVDRELVGYWLSELTLFCRMNYREKANSGCSKFL